MPEEKRKSDRDLLESVAQELASVAQELGDVRSTGIRTSARVAAIAVDISDLKRDAERQADHLDRIDKNVDRFMTLHEKLDHEFASMKADLDRVKQAVRGLGGKLD